jgi:acyl dehydratase
MKFADFHVGQVITSPFVSLSAEEITEFASRWDPQWFHTDPQAAANSRFEGLIASGWQTCGLAMRLAVQCALHDSESFASPGVAYLKWPHPVRPGERLRLRAEVLELRRSRTQADLGILRWRWNLLHEDGRTALELEVTSLFDLSRSRGQPNAAGSTPAASQDRW